MGSSITFVLNSTKKKKIKESVLIDLCRSLKRDDLEVLEDPEKFLGAEPTWADIETIEKFKKFASKYATPAAPLAK